jgi:hypothetical protein
MAATERLLVSASSVMYYHHHPLVSHPTKMNMYIALQNKNGVSCLTIRDNERQLTMPYGG